MNDKAGQRVDGTRYLCAISLLSACFFAQADTLSDVYRKARTSDPVYRAAEYTLQATRERIPQARSALLPAISVVGATGRQAGQASFNEAPYADRNVQTRSWTLQLTQPLWRAASWAALDQAQYQVVLAEAQFRLAEQDLILRTAQIYLDILVAQEALRAARTQVMAVEQQLGFAQRSFEVGTGTITDVHESKSRLDLARAQNVSVDSDLSNKRAELTRLIGNTNISLADFRDDRALPSLDPATAIAWTESARGQSLQVRIAEASVKIADQEIAKHRAAHAPSIELTAARAVNYSSGSITSPADISVRSRSNQLGLNLNIPLFSGGATSSRVREAIALKNKAEEDLIAAQRQAAAQTQRAFTGVISGVLQTEALASAINSSKSSLEANKIGYRIGTRTNIDVLNAEQQLYATRRDWYRARADALLQGLRLKASNATLSEADLNVVNNLLEEQTP